MGWGLGLLGEVSRGTVYYAVPRVGGKSIAGSHITGASLSLEEGAGVSGQRSRGKLFCGPTGCPVCWAG